MPRVRLMLDRCVALRDSPIFIKTTFSFTVQAVMPNLGLLFRPLPTRMSLLLFNGPRQSLRNLFGIPPPTISFAVKNAVSSHLIHFMVTCKIGSKVKILAIRQDSTRLLPSNLAELAINKFLSLTQYFNSLCKKQTFLSEKIRFLRSLTSSIA